jgi:hypothetical protein
LITTEEKKSINKDFVLKLRKLNEAIEWVTEEKIRRQVAKEEAILLNPWKQFMNDIAQTEDQNSVLYFSLDATNLSKHRKFAGLAKSLREALSERPISAKKIKKINESLSALVTGIQGGDLARELRVLLFFHSVDPERPTYRHMSQQVDSMLDTLSLEGSRKKTPEADALSQFLDALRACKARVALLEIEKKVVEQEKLLFVPLVGTTNTKQAASAIQNFLESGEERHMQKCLQGIPETSRQYRAFVLKVRKLELFTASGQEKVQRLMHTTHDESLKKKLALLLEAIRSVMQP